MSLTLKEYRADSLVRCFLEVEVRRVHRGVGFGGTSPHVLARKKLIVGFSNQFRSKRSQLQHI